LHVLVLTKLACADRCHVPDGVTRAVQVAGPPVSNGRKKARVVAPTRPAKFEQEVPTVAHGIRCPARQAPWRVDHVWAIEEKGVIA
jgi:hypothetical protein